MANLCNNVRVRRTATVTDCVAWPNPSISGGSAHADTGFVHVGKVPRKLEGPSSHLLRFSLAHRCLCHCGRWYVDEVHALNTTY